MNDRVTKVLLVGLAALTLLVIVISELGLFDESPPVLPDPDPDPPAATTREKTEPAPDEKTVGPETTEGPTDTGPEETTVKVTWRLVAAALPSPTAAESKPLRPEGLVPLPTVRGRLVIRTPRDTGGVTSVAVVHGSPLAFTQKVVKPSSSVYAFRGAGRDARILRIVFAGGETVLRMLDTRGLGPTAMVMHIAGLGACSGRVLDRSGKPVVGATVRIDDATTATDATGGFAFAQIRGGTPILSVTAPGFAAHREPIPTARRFGEPDAPAYVPEVRLTAGRRITIRARSDTVAGGAITWHVLPFGYQLSNPHLAIEAMTGLRAPVGEAVVIEHAPAGQALVVVGEHPAFDHVYRRIDAGTAELDLAYELQERRRVAGRVTAQASGKAIDEPRIESSLDEVSLGDYLGAAARIPTGHRVCNFPLPSLDTPVATPPTIEADGRFELRQDRGAALRLRASAMGYATATVAIDDDETVAIALPPKRGAGPGRIRMSVTLGSHARIADVRHRGIDVTAPTECQPGHVLQTIPDIPAGQYEVTIEAPGYEPYTGSLRVDADDERRLVAFLSLNAAR